MGSYLDKIKGDLVKLINKGKKMVNYLIKAEKEKLEDNAKQYHAKFSQEYQKWYSEAYELISQILPNRLDEFAKLYQGDIRKEINYTTYTIQDWLLGRYAKINFYTKSKEFDDIGIMTMRFYNQLQILESAQMRFESSPFDIQQIARADLFDSELDASRELLKTGFFRPAGVLAGVVLEKHLQSVCKNHKVLVSKKNPTISDYNDLLKNVKAIDILKWRLIQRLGDIRNLCAHIKEREPTKDEVNDLIEETDKIIKTIF